MVTNIQMLMRALLLLACVALTVPAEGVTHAIGVARGADDAKIRYIEHHQYLDDGSHIIRYYDASDSLLLEKEIAYPGLPQHPTIRQLDPRSNVLTTVTRDPSGEHATITRAQEQESDSFSFALSEDIVIDAGFDQYIRAYWDSFTDTPDQTVRFAVPGQNRLIKMRISRTGVSAEGATFRIKPENWVVRLLLPEIRLNYDGKRLLKRYEGFSNLKPENTSGRDVVITFDHYEREQTTARPTAAWLATGAE